MRKLLHSGLLILLAVAFFAAAARVNPVLRDQRRDQRLTQADPLENAPPLLAFTTVALGGFRGILADVLWLRSGRLQQEGKYFELVQLADWITKLEPRFTSVWAFHGWNMAYNISVLFESPEDRWRWVQNGLRLLRDEGLVYNRDNARLMYELGWIYQHKIGAGYDQAHTVYKRRLAEEMIALFPGPRPDFDALLAASVADPEGLTPDGRAAKTLREVYKFDLSTMALIEKQYGPLDWRLPQAHAIYWGYRSRSVARGNEVISADRMIFQSLADAFRSGSLFINAAEDVFVPSPNLNLLPRVIAAYDEAQENSPDISSVTDARRTFIEQAIVILYTYQRNRQALDLLQGLRAKHPDKPYPVDVGDFVAAQLAAAMKTMSQEEATAYVEGFLVQSVYFQALGDSERAAGFAQAARVIWADYMRPRMNDADFVERTGLPPLEEIRTMATAKVLGILQNEANRRAISGAGAP